MLTWVVKLLQQLWESLQGSLIKKIAAWLFMLLGGVLGDLGYTLSNVEYIVGAVVSVLAALLFDLVAHVKTYNVVPKSRK